MDCSTHIDDLPIDTIKEEQIKEEDGEECYIEPPKVKKVNFNDDIKYNDINYYIDSSKKLNINEKMYGIIFLVFFIFQEPKVKKYIFEILNVIIGSIIYNPSGSVSRIGSSIYSVFFIIIIWCLNEYINSII